MSDWTREHSRKEWPNITIFKIIGWIVNLALVIVVLSFPRPEWFFALFLTYHFNKDMVDKFRSDEQSRKNYTDYQLKKGVVDADIWDSESHSSSEYSSYRAGYFF